MICQQLAQSLQRRAQMPSNYIGVQGSAYLSVLPECLSAIVGLFSCWFAGLNHSLSDHFVGYVLTSKRLQSFKCSPVGLSDILQVSHRCERLRRIGKRGFDKCQDTRDIRYSRHAAGFGNGKR